MSHRAPARDRRGRVWRTGRLPSAGGLDRPGALGKYLDQCGLFSGIHAEPSPRLIGDPVDDVPAARGSHVTRDGDEITVVFQAVVHGSATLLRFSQGRLR